MPRHDDEVSFIQINPATLAGGYSMMTDLLGSLHVSASKLRLGSAGVDEGFVGSTNPLPVSLVGGLNGGATEATLQQARAWLESIYDRLGDGGAWVTVSASALPAGAATASGQSSIASLLGQIYARQASGSHVVIDSFAGLTDAQLRASSVPVSASALPLPSGAATDVLQGEGNASLASVDGKLPALASGRVPVDGSGVIQPISGTVSVLGPLTNAELRASSVPVIGPLTDAQLRATPLPVSVASLPLPSGAATEATLAARAAEHVTAASPHAARLSDGSAFYVAAMTGQFPSALVGGRLDANAGAWLGSTAPTVGQKAMASSLPVTVASDQPAMPVQESRSSACSLTLIDSVNTNTTLLASNANRVGVTIFNDSTASLYVRFGSTASTSDFHVLLAPGGYFEMPFRYTGRIDGIWSAANGKARVGEFT